MSERAMQVTFIGGGNMAQALLGGLLAGDFRAPDLRVVEIRAEQRKRLQEQFGVSCYEGAQDAIREDDVIVLAVKPQQLREAVGRLALARNANLLVSIAAGARLGSLSRWLGGYTRLVRAMPNTPALIGEAITGLYAFPGEDVSGVDRRRAEAILAAVGTSVWVEREEHMDAVTAVSGSGPAYVFYFIEAMQEAAAQLGLAPETARRLAQQTFIGAARLAAGSADPVSALRERVTSRGGTTERALSSMERDKVREAIGRALRAAYERGREIGDELGRN